MTAGTRQALSHSYTKREWESGVHYDPILDLINQASIWRNRFWTCFGVLVAVFFAAIFLAYLWVMR